MEYGIKGMPLEGGTSQPRTLIGGNSSQTWIEYPVAALIEAREKAARAIGSSITWWTKRQNYVRISFRGLGDQQPGGFGIPRAQFLVWAERLLHIGPRPELWQYEPEGRFHYYDDSAESRLVRYEDGTVGYFFWFENSGGWHAFVNVILAGEQFDEFLEQVQSFRQEFAGELLFDQRRVQ